jgi:hypothetical protein
MDQQFPAHSPNSLRSAAPGVGLGLDPSEVDSYLAAVGHGLVVAETRCDRGMQDDKALRAATSVTLAPAAV